MMQQHLNKIEALSHDYPSVHISSDRLKAGPYNVCANILRAVGVIQSHIALLMLLGHPCVGVVSKIEDFDNAPKLQFISSKERNTTMPITHPFGPLYNSESKILILGSFPSVKSREANFFYGHPQNRFWKVMASVLNSPVPVTIEEKREMLLNGHIALWDSLASCDIVGSSDSSITNPVANDLSPIFKAADIQLLCFNGRKSEEIYYKYGKRTFNVAACSLPSTSPANAQFNLERLIKEWSNVLLPALNCLRQ